MHTAHRGRNGHAVVIEDDEYAAPQNFDAVERFVHEPVVEGAIPDESDDVIVLPF